MGVDFWGVWGIYAALFGPLGVWAGYLGLGVDVFGFTGWVLDCV